MITCTSIRCTEYSTATNMGLCKNGHYSTMFGEDTRFYCQVKAANGKMAYSTEPFTTGERVCTDYIGD